MRWESHPGQCGCGYWCCGGGGGERRRKRKRELSHDARRRPPSALNPTQPQAAAVERDQGSGGLPFSLFDARFSGPFPYNRHHHMSLRAARTRYQGTRGTPPSPPHSRSVLVACSFTLLHAHKRAENSITRSTPTPSSRRRTGVWVGISSTGKGLCW